MEDINNVIDKLIGESTRFAKDQLKVLIRNGKSDSTELIRDMGEMTEKYIRQRQAGEITNSEFKELMEDVLELNEMQYNKLSVEAKVRTDKIKDGFKDLVVNKLLALI